MRLFIALAYLAIQLLVMVFGLIEPDIHFRWAPFDTQTEYWVTVEIGGHKLTDGEVEDRYGEPAVGIENHSIAHIQRLIEQYEETYGLQEGAEVLMRYRSNGGEMEQWQWPRR